MWTIWRQWWRLGGAAGIAFVVVTLAIRAVPQSELPFVDDPIEDVRAYWTNEGQQYLVVKYLLDLTLVFFFIPFIAALRTLLGQAEGTNNFWSRVSFVGGLFIVLWISWSNIFWGALAFGDFAESASDETLRALMVLDYYDFSGLSLSYLIFVGPASLVVAQTGVLWRWIVVLGAIEVVLSVLAPLKILSASGTSIFDISSFFAFLILLLWILLVGILMLRMRDEPMPVAS